MHCTDQNLGFYIEFQPVYVYILRWFNASANFSYSLYWMASFIITLKDTDARDIFSKEIEFCGDTIQDISVIGDIIEKGWFHMKMHRTKSFRTKIERFVFDEIVRWFVAISTIY